VFVPKSGMPIYEYQCPNCFRTKEVFYKGHDNIPEIVVCGERGCNGLAKRVFGSFSIKTDSSGGSAKPVGNKKYLCGFLRGVIILRKN
jgi:putative FmdB family regulatory protein